MDARFQLQILLYLLKLSLPGPPPPPDSPAKGHKESRKGPRPAAPTLSYEDRLEAFMDKLAVWQLMAGLEQTSTKSHSISDTKDERDWMQVFFEETVEPQCEFATSSTFLVNLTCHPYFQVQI